MMIIVFLIITLRTCNIFVTKKRERDLYIFKYLTSALYWVEFTKKSRFSADLTCLSVFLGLRFSLPDSISSATLNFVSLVNLT